MTPAILETLKKVVVNMLEKSLSAAKQWDIRSFVLTTLFLQTMLLLVAPFRKQTANPKFLGVVWLAFLLSDWASNFAVGLIPAAKDQASTEYGSDLLMLWAPFLLLHVGGADSIAALTPTDNELWSRFAIQLATMIYGIGNAFYRSFLESRLRVLVILMFVAGLTKYVERLLCFFQARFSSLKESLLQEKAKSPLGSLDLDCNSHELSDAEMVRDASRLFKSFRMLYVDLQVNSEHLAKSREYFRCRNSRDAFRVAEIELNFSYDLFYSKGPVIQQGLGRFLRPVGILCEVATLLLWLRIDKRSFRKFDLRATYALILGAVARDFVSLMMMLVSDWSIGSIVRNPNDSKLINGWLSLRKQRWGKYSSPKDAPWLMFLSRALFRRWSESISQLNFIDLCFDQRLISRDIAYESLGIDFFMNKLRRVPKKWFTNDLRDLIFQELNNRASEGNSCLSRGQWTLESYEPKNEELLRLSRTYVGGKTFDESLLMWHIATSICYHTVEQERLEESEKHYRELSRVLSNYMLYLLLWMPEMMMEVAAMGDLRYEATRREAKKHFWRWIETRRERCPRNDRIRTPMNAEDVCKILLRKARRANRIKDEEKSVFFGACRLAVELKQLENNQVVMMWEVIAKVWVEMLGYGAARCSPSAHVAQLANGGQLITLVWLLMGHMGMGKI